MTRFVPLALVLALALGGCAPTATAPPPAGSTGKQDNLFPPADGGGLGTLRFACDSCSNTQLLVDDTAVTVDQRLFLAPGEHTISLTGDTFTGLRTIEVASDKETVVPLRWLTFSGNGNRDVDGWQATSLGEPIWSFLFAGETPIARALYNPWAGSVNRGFLSFDDVLHIRTTVGKGGTILVDTSVTPDASGTVHLDPDPRVLGYVAVARQSTTLKDANEEEYVASGSMAPEALFALDRLARTTLFTTDKLNYRGLDSRLALVPNAVWKPTYFAWVNGTYQTFTVVLGENPNIELGRLDVFDVAETATDGTPTHVAGTFSVAWRQPSGVFVAVPELADLPTRRGVNLVKGRYRVTVTHVPPGKTASKSATYEVEI